MSAKVTKKYRFFHLLRFLRMETVAKRTKRPTLSDIGEHVLAQYERRLRTEEYLTAVTIRNCLSDLHNFTPWRESIWKQGREEEPPFTSEVVTTPILTDCRAYPHHRFGYRMAVSVPLYRLAQLMATIRLIQR